MKMQEITRNLLRSVVLEKGRGLRVLEGFDKIDGGAVEKVLTRVHRGQEFIYALERQKAEQFACIPRTDHAALKRMMTRYDRVLKTSSRLKRIQLAMARALCGKGGRA